MRRQFGIVLLGLSACAAHASPPVAPVDTVPAHAPAEVSQASTDPPTPQTPTREHEKEVPSGTGLARNAPKDQPVAVEGKSRLDDLHAAIAPYVEEGRRTYPGAKKRYLAGLPAGHTFFVVTRLRDAAGSSEQVFITVTGIKDGRISGRIASEILGVEGYKQGQPYDFPEADLIDWLVSRPDGSEEGNVVGKFLDEWQKR